MKDPLLLLAAFFIISIFFARLFKKSAKKDWVVDESDEDYIKRLKQSQERSKNIEKENNIITKETPPEGVLMSEYLEGQRTGKYKKD